MMLNSLRSVSHEDGNQRCGWNGKAETCSIVAVSIVRHAASIRPDLLHIVPTRWSLFR
jgi:hypothetical protein